jgi:hypothetical protein
MTRHTRLQHKLSSSHRDARRRKLSRRYPGPRAQEYKARRINVESLWQVFFGRKAKS